MDTVHPPSYRALFAVRGLPRLVASMSLARIAGQMVSLALVLLALERYGSATVAGLVTFLAVAPGLVASPIAGALLDRHGRTRLVVLDYALAAFLLTLIAVLAFVDELPIPLLLVLVATHSITGPMSNTGVRTLFPILVPPKLWERANAIDSNGYVVASIFGPAASGALVAAFGAPTALIVTAAIYAGAAVAAAGLHDPSIRTEQRDLFGEAWRGFLYVLRNPTLRVLALCISVANIGSGLFFIALPVLVFSRLGGDAAYVGDLFALLGVTGFVTVLLMGRVSTRGRERRLFAYAMLGQGAAYAVIILAGSNAIVVAVGMLLVGIATGPFDVTLFTLRQRRTDPAWMGRAFAVSMALNFAGFPIGSALGGAVVPVSIDVALGLAVVANVVGALLAQLLPRDH